MSQCPQIRITGAACGVCPICAAEVGRMIERQQAPPEGAQVHHLKVAERPPEEPAREMVVRIVYRPDGMMFVDAEKGIPAPILATMSVVFEDFMRAHLIRGGT